MARKLSETVKLNLRFSEELRRKLEKAAERNNQSMNLEIVARLEESFRRIKEEEIIQIAVEAAIATTLKRIDDIQKRATAEGHRTFDFQEALLGIKSKEDGK